MAKTKEVENKEVKKGTKQKKQVKKEKEIEVVDAIVDDVTEEIVEEKVENKPRKTYKELKAEFRAKKYDIEVEIINLNSCSTTCRGRDGRLIFSLDKTGDREFVTLADISEVASKYKGFFENHHIAIVDIDTLEYELEDIIEYLNLNEIYEENGIENYDTDYISQILKLEPTKFRRFIEDANEKLVEVVASRAVELFRNGKFDSRIKEESLCNRLGREDLFEI